MASKCECSGKANRNYRASWLSISLTRRLLETISGNQLTSSEFIFFHRSSLWINRHVQKQASIWFTASHVQPGHVDQWSGQRINETSDPSQILGRLVYSCSGWYFKCAVHTDIKIQVTKHCHTSFIYDIHFTLLFTRFCYFCNKDKHCIRHLESLTAFFTLHTVGVECK